MTVKGLRDLPTSNNKNKVTLLEIKRIRQFSGTKTNRIYKSWKNGYLTVSMKQKSTQYCHIRLHFLLSIQNFHSTIGLASSKVYFRDILYLTNSITDTKVCQKNGLHVTDFRLLVLLFHPFALSFLFVRGYRPDFACKSH